MRPSGQKSVLGRFFVWAAALHVLSYLGLVTAAQAAGDESAIARGAYIFRAAGCLTCHTDTKNKGAPLAGGRALTTPFGTFYSPNITPDPVHGIGAWSDADFIAALRQGRAPDGRHYYPAFPYPSYTGMSARDMRDLKAYLFSRPAVATPNRAHDLKFPFGFRAALWPWKLLFFTEGRRVEDPGKDARWNRGAYLVENLGHCGECHTPRNFLGAVDQDLNLAGNATGPDGKKVPNITPHPGKGIGDWSESDLMYYLKTGFLPDGDFAGGAMVDVIQESTGFLSGEDRAAIASYLFSLAPISSPGPGSLDEIAPDPPAY
jgi:mono/diheme cytochrome c family protein